MSSTQMETCPSSAAFFGYMGVASSMVFGSEYTCCISWKPSLGGRRGGYLCRLSLENEGSSGEGGALWLVPRVPADVKTPLRAPLHFGPVERKVGCISDCLVPSCALSWQIYRACVCLRARFANLLLGVKVMCPVHHRRTAPVYPNTTCEQCRHLVRE